MQLPPDLMNMKISQHLVIEEGRLDIICSWPSGVKLSVHSFIPSSPNVLVIHWQIEPWNEETRMGHNKPPVWLWLYRWADPTIEEYASRFDADFMHGGFKTFGDPKVTPLPPPSVREVDNWYVIEQTFPPDPLFKDGFRYWMAPFAPNADIHSVDMQPIDEARIRIMPKEATEGWLAVDIPTSSDAGGVSSECQRFYSALAENPIKTMTGWQEEAARAAKDFFSKSSVTIADKLIENLWYETLHVRRCTYRYDTVPPGLYLPSTVRDYSHWHGDYHTNYNFQSPFLGDYEANHIEIGDAYFKGMEYFLQIGRKIAHDYYHCRGAFIQLSGFPVYAEDDYMGIAPMGRMAYMTGWAMEQYWVRYLVTLDKDWLQEKGYPVIRDCALFYTDFLKKGEDGLYHAFPSNQGEDGFTGDPWDYTDRPQVMQYMGYCLRTAIKASEELGVDDDLQAQWQERLEHAAPAYYGKLPIAVAFADVPLEKLEGLEKLCAERNPPEFGRGRPYKPQPKDTTEPSPLTKKEYWIHAAGSDIWTWYYGKAPMWFIRMLRTGSFVADRDFKDFRNLILRWRHPNGLLWAMSVANYGHCGAWTESLGIIAPLQEMMLQSWDGILRIFPAWPTNLSASFRDFRAEGAFLVSASWADGTVVSAEIFSEVGGRCRLYPPWSEGVQVTDDNMGQLVKVVTELEGVVHFETQAGHIYKLSRPAK